MSGKEHECDCGPIPGIHWPTLADGMTPPAGWSWVERCDLCHIYPDDELAARALTLMGHGTTVAWFDRSTETMWPARRRGASVAIDVPHDEAETIVRAVAPLPSDPFKAARTAAAVAIEAYVEARRENEDPNPIEWSEVGAAAADAALEAYRERARKPVVLTIRDPDYENGFTVDGDVRIIDVDLGGAFNGPKYFWQDLGEAEGREWIAGHREEVADLLESSPVRRAVEGLLQDLEQRAPGQR